MRRLEISEPLFMSRVLFLDGIEWAQAQKLIRQWMRRRGKEPLNREDDLSDAHGAFFRGTDRHFAIWVRKSRNTQILAHEAAHAANALMRSIGMKVNRHTEELLACYLDWIVWNFK